MFAALVIAAAAGASLSAFFAFFAAVCASLSSS